MTSPAAPAFPINRTKQLLRQGACAYGMSVHDIRGISIPHVFAQIGYDNLFFDMEHSPDGFGPLCDMMWSCRRSGITPIVRVADPERFFLSRCLDAGAQGVIVPRVETVEQVDAIVSYCRYAPVGTRGIALGGRHMDYLPPGDWHETMREANEQVFVGIMIETPQGLEAVEAIAARPGIDNLFIGPADLSHAVGTPGDLLSPAMDAAIARIVTAAKKNGLTLGIQGVNAELSTHWMKMGVRYFLLGNVMIMMRQASLQAITQLKAAIGQAGVGGSR
jgi:2-keto-3-deoxy-L-rhamnonate aldolase RhmA